MSSKELETIANDKEWANDTIIEAFSKEFINQ